LKKKKDNLRGCPSSFSKLKIPNKNIPVLII